MGDINIKYQYPRNPNYYYETKLERVNLDEEREKSISSGNGFVVSEIQSTLRKELKNINGIYSTRFGQTLQDVNPFIDRYRCQCGKLRGKLYDGLVCPECGEKVKYVGDDFDYFGWICLKDPYYIIHPNLFESIKAFLGKIGKSKDYILNRILLPNKFINKDGFLAEAKGNDDEPFFGLGILDFRDRFEEVMKYYMKKNNTPQKRLYYEDIMRDKDKVFIQSIPVYTTLLRPFKEDADTFHFERNNAKYHLMTRLVQAINNDELRIFRKEKPKLQLLNDLTLKYQELYEEINNITGGKKGIIRNLFGGRYSFTSREVIVPDPTLDVDEVSLSRVALSELMQQTIINILHTTYGMTFNQAYLTWYKGQLERNQIIVDIINQIIKENNGIPILINRNPTINYGGILYMRVVKITDSFTMGVPLDILSFLAADFDGDVLNIHYIINNDFRVASERIFSPKNAMYISRNDGWAESAILPYKDILININTLSFESKVNYSKEQVDKLKQLASI